MNQPPVPARRTPPDAELTDDEQHEQRHPATLLQSVRHGQQPDAAEHVHRVERGRPRAARGRLLRQGRTEEGGGGALSSCCASEAACTG